MYLRDINQKKRKKKKKLKKKKKEKKKLPPKNKQSRAWRSCLIQALVYRKFAFCISHWQWRVILIYSYKENPLMIITVHVKIKRGHISKRERYKYKMNYNKFYFVFSTINE